MNLQLTSTQGGASGSATSASGQSGSTSARSGQSGAGSSTTAGGSTSGSQRNSASGGQSGGQDQQMAQFAQEVKQECLNLTQAELGRKQGAEFDKAYIGQQLVAHTNMLAELRAAQRHASGQLQPIIQQGTQMTEHHLAQARQIMEQLDAGGAAGGASGAPRSGATPAPPRR
jgi:hypothetical protein